MNSVSLDWFSVTFHTTLDNHIDYALSLIKVLTGEDTIDWLPYSRLRGYNKCGTVLDGLGLVGLDDSSSRSLDMGVHLSLSASALGILADRFGVTDLVTGEVYFDFITFIQSVVSFSPPEYYSEMSDKPYVSVTRCDFALDDNEGLLNMSAIEELCVLKWSGQVPMAFSTRFRSPALSHKSLGGAGATIYFGSVTSAARIRFYDKAAEKSLQGQHWVRCELQLREDRSDIFCRTIKTASDISALVLNYLDFKNLDGDLSDTNISRVDTAPWWAEFLGVNDKLKLCAGTVSRKVEDLDKWIDRQVSTALAVVFECLGEARLSTLIKDGVSRFRKKHKDMIAYYKEVNGERKTDLIIESLRLGGSLVVSDETRAFMDELNYEKRSKSFTSFISSISGLYSAQLKAKILKERVQYLEARRKKRLSHLLLEVQRSCGDNYQVALFGY